MNTALALWLVFNVNAAGKPSVIPQEFEKLLSEAKLNLTLPSGFETVDVQPNSAVEYQFAAKAKNGGFEVRYAVQIDNDRSMNPDFSKNPLAISLKSLAEKISGGGDHRVVMSAPFEASKNYGANEVFSMMKWFGPKAAGWTGYKYCHISAIRKAGVSKAYVFYLFNDREAVQPSWMAVAKALRY